MERGDFIRTMDTCLMKASLGDTWPFSPDGNDKSAFYLDNDGFLVFHAVQIPYNIDSVERIKYGYWFNDDRYIALDMTDGSRLRIGKRQNEAYVLLQKGKADDIVLYKAQLND